MRKRRLNQRNENILEKIVKYSHINIFVFVFKQASLLLTRIKNNTNCNKLMFHMNNIFIINLYETKFPENIQL
jgi:hypothetical protein